MTGAVVFYGLAGWCLVRAITRDDAGALYGCVWLMVVGTAMAAAAILKLA